ncbi:hypothetical protein Tco_0379145 [Tanacetum coccineum]
MSTPTFAATHNLVAFLEKPTESNVFEQIIDFLNAKPIKYKPPTKAQKRTQMSTYLKHMGNYKHSHLKNKTYEETERLFKIEMKRVNLFIPMDVDKEVDEQVETEKNNDLKEEEMKNHMEIVRDDNIAIDAIPLESKPSIIVKCMILKAGIIGHFQLIREDGSLKRYSSMIKMLQVIDREDLQILWKLVKTKQGDTGPEDEYKRVLWGDLKVMSKPDIMSEVWRSLQEYNVLIWNLFDSCGVHYSKVTTVNIKGSTAGTYYCLCSVSAAGIKSFNC